MITKRVTLQDVALHAGVSRSTASLVIRGSTKISQRTTERVQDAIRDLGYVYNRAAAQMRGARTMTIGVIVPEVRNPYLSELIMTIEAELRGKGYVSLIGHSGDDVSRESEIVRTLLERDIDGVVLHPAHAYGPLRFDQELMQRGIPVVSVMRYLESGSSFVGPDNFAAGRLVGSHLRALGVESALFVGGPRDASARLDRVDGVRVGLGDGVDFSADDSMSTTSNFSDVGQEVMASVLDGGRLPDAVIAFSDIVSVGICNELGRRGLVWGQDVALAGFDDIPMASLLTPGLTSVSMFPDEVGRTAAEMIVDAVEGREREREVHLVDPLLRVRGSTLSWQPRR